MALKSDELNSVRAGLKKALKGRPLYFGLMAPSGKKGKFRISKKKGDVKPAELKKDYKPYDDSTENDVKGTACMGVCSGTNGVLTLQVQGKAPAAAIGFLEYFIQRQVRFKQVKQVKIAEVQSLPEVPELSKEELQKRINELDQEFQLVAPQNEQIKARLEAAKLQLIKDLDRADQLLDEVEELIEQVSPSRRESDQDQGTAPTRTVDPEAIQAQLLVAKENMDSLAPKYRGAVEQKLKAAVVQLKEGIKKKDTQPELLVDVQAAADEIDDMIDGGYQDFYLTWLKSLEELEKKIAFNDEAHASLKATKAAIRNRNWKEATTRSQETEKRLKALSGTKSAAVDAAKKAGARESRVDEAPLDARSTYKKWDDARRAAQAGLDALAKALRDTGEQRFQDIVARGLAQLTTRIDLCDRKFGLQAALLGLELTPVGQRNETRKHVLDSIASYRKQLFEDQTVKKAMELADENPFKVKLDLQKGLGQALLDIDRQVQAVKVV